MMFIKCSAFHKMYCVAWKQEYTYIHAYAAFQTQMYLAGLYLPLSWTVTATIKTASECVLISITVKFLLNKRQSKLLVHSTIKWPMAMFLKWLPHPVKQEWYWCHIQIHLLSQAVWLMVLMLFTFTYIPLVNMQRTKYLSPRFWVITEIRLTGHRRLIIVVQHLSQYHQALHSSPQCCHPLVTSEVCAR